jgi:ribosomal 30S subunit maturation factor RimM
VVTEVLKTGGVEVLLIAGPEREHMVPMADEICVEVDVERKVIRVDPPEGLLDL